MIDDARPTEVSAAMDETIEALTHLSRWFRGKDDDGTADIGLAMTVLNFSDLSETEQVVRSLVTEADAYAREVREIAQGLLGESL